MQKFIDDNHKKILFINDGTSFTEDDLHIENIYDDYDIYYYLSDNVRDKQKFATTIGIGNLFLQKNPSHTLNYITQNGSMNWSAQMDIEESLYSNFQFFSDPSRIKFEILNNIIKNNNDSECYGFLFDFMKLSDAKTVDDKINLFIKDIKDDNSLSTFDKLMAIQLICTSFIDSDKSEEVLGQILQVDCSKGLPSFGTALKILGDADDSYKIKCSGYVDLFARMAYKLGINARPLLVYNKELGFMHAVAKVDIYDPKYCIDGTYICDLRSDNDFREWCENETRNTIEEQGKDIPFWSFASIRYFCVDKNDFEIASGLAKSNSPTEYYSGCPEDKKEISRGRIDLNTYKTSLLHVYEHIYSWIGADRDIADRIVNDAKSSVGLIKQTRNFIDEKMFDNGDGAKVVGGK